MINQRSTAGYSLFDTTTLSERIRQVGNFHKSLPSFSPTRIHNCPALAKELNLGELFVKDESSRLNLKAFKALGASYAIYRFLSKQKTTDIIEPADFWSEVKRSAFGRRTFSTATDGNHGRAVAWAARLVKQKATIFMPDSASASRIANIESEGAKVMLVPGSYDEAVRTAAELAEINGWQIISDTSYQGYTEIPNWISDGYLTLFDEVNRVVESFDIIIVPSGVGALLAAAALYYQNSSKTKIISVEPSGADCLLVSAKSEGKKVTSLKGPSGSVMVGLDCGTPSMVAWEIIKDRVDGFISIPDSYAIEAMKRYYFPIGNDPRIISGETGAASLAGLLALLSAPALQPIKEHLGLNHKSRVLVLNTEGDTDPQNFSRIVNS